MTSLGQAPKIHCFGQSSDGIAIISPAINITPILMRVAVGLEGLRFQETRPLKRSAFLNQLNFNEQKVPNLMDKMRKMGMDITQKKDGNYCLKIPHGRRFFKNPKEFIGEVNTSLKNPTFLNVAIRITNLVQRDIDELTREITKDTFF